MSDVNNPFTVKVEAFQQPKGPETVDEYKVLQELQRWFQLDFELWNIQTGQLVSAPTDFSPGLEVLEKSSALVEAAPSQPCDLINLSEQVGILLVPLSGCGRPELIGVARVLLTLGAGQGQSWIQSEAQRLAVSVAELTSWADRQDRWSDRQLFQLAAHFQSHITSSSNSHKLKRTVDDLSEKISSTYEEITLLYSLTENLKITSSDQQLVELCLEGALDVLPAESMAIQLLPPVDADEANFDVRREVELYSEGRFPLNTGQLNHLVQLLNCAGSSQPVIANTPVTSSRSWPYPEIRQLVLVPLVEADNRFGYMALANHVTDQEFGSVEAHLLSSMATIVGIHLGNLEHYRQHKELLANVVRTLTTAIEVKDPYTCGHSERVARIAVLLAKELGVESRDLQTLYMGGLLHDVGKIGIEDSVLRKPGRLTDEEFEHIKQHPTLGYNILEDVKQFNELLPIVLQHHEQFDGQGYPGGLVGDQTHWLARITAVADAYDAMTSDRPYRKGMPHERVRQIFSEGYNQQWDGAVLDAFYRIEDQIRESVSQDRKQLPLNVKSWLPE